MPKLKPKNLTIDVGEAFEPDPQKHLDDYDAALLAAELLNAGAAKSGCFDCLARACIMAAIAAVRCQAATYWATMTPGAPPPEDPHVPLDAIIPILSNMIAEASEISRASYREWEDGGYGYVPGFAIPTTGGPGGKA